MPTKPLLTARLTAALAASGLSQSDLARRVGVTRGAVNSWLTGRAVALRPEHLFATADALGIEARWLATGQGPRERQPLTGEQRRLLDSYQTLTTAERAAVTLLLNQIADTRATYDKGNA